MLKLLLLAIAWNVVLPASAGEQIRVVGSTTVLPIVAEAAKVFRQRHPEVRLTVSGGGSGVGAASVARGTAEIGMLSRPLSERERQRLGKRAELVPIARDAVTIAVSKAVYLAGVRQLSLPQIAAIYRGEIVNWRAVGGADSPILVVDKEASRGTRHVFAKIVLGHEYARAPGARVISGSNNEEQAIIAGSDKAIGMLSHAWLNDAVRGIGIEINGQVIAPSLENIANGQYPIHRDLNVLLGETAPAMARRFVAFLLSPEGQAIVRANGYVAVRQ